jgi:outer membrane protein insertion porin family
VIEYRVDEGARYWIASIEFDGNEEVSDETLAAVMRTRPASHLPFGSAGVLDDAVLADDLRKIWFLYRRLGFESAEIVDVHTRFEADGGIDLTIDVEEGPRSIVAEVTSSGFAAVTEVPTLQTRAGAPFNPEVRDADVKSLIAALSRAGHAEARVQAEVTSVRSGSRVETTVHFVAEPGPFQEIGPVIVQNNLITKDRVVLRELPFEEGGPYDPQALIDGQANVYRLGLFRRVAVRPLEPAEGGSVPVAVQVDERPAGTFSYGFGYETDIGFRAFGEAAYDNLQGMDRRLSLRGDVSVLPSHPEDSQYLGNLGFRSPRLFDTRWVSRSNAILLRNTQELNRFSLEGFTLATALERELAPRLIVGGILEWDQGDTFDVAADASLAAEGVKDIGFLRQVSIGPFLEFDRRDDPFAPRSGTLETMRVRYAARALNSDIRFLTLVGKHVQYVPLLPSLDFVYALRGALALPLDGKFSVPIRDRYFIGGRTTVRGFEENSIAPLGADGSPMGGDVMVNGNAELRFPLLFGLGGAVFLDAGGSFLRQECTAEVCNFSAVSADNVRRSTGIGLRYLTPVGPISLEYGFKLDRREGESLGAFHFTIGNIF